MAQDLRHWVEQQGHTNRGDGEWAFMGTCKSGDTGPTGHCRGIKPQGGPVLGTYSLGGQYRDM